MRRKHREEKEYEPDLIYQSPKVTKFINYLTKRKENCCSKGFLPSNGNY